MRKCFVVIRRNYSGMQDIDVLAVFANEGEAEQSAKAHHDPTHSAWVEEVNFYE